MKDGALKHAKKLLAIGCFCIGTNQVDLEVNPCSGQLLPASGLHHAPCPAALPPWERAASWVLVQRLGSKIIT